MALIRRHPVATFSVVSLVTMAALAVVLGVVLQHRIADRALASAADTTEVLGELAIRRYIAPDELRSELRPDTRRQLGDHLATVGLRNVGVKEVKIFDDRRRLVYSAVGSALGKPAPPASNVARALSGDRVESLSRGTSDDGQGDQTLSVYAPLRYGREVAGAFEVYLDYTPTAAAARRDVAKMWAVVAGGFVVLWLALFHLVRSVSSALRRQTEENRHQATHDTLTGLPNRARLFERLADATAGGGALLQLDLDGFRDINDTLSHDHGDELLVEVARRLRSAVTDGDLVARLGGDDFAILRPGTVDESEARVLAGALVESLRVPLHVSGTTVMVDATVGLALAAEGDDAAGLARRAEVALYEAKRRQTRIEVYDADRDHRDRGRLELLGELGGAIRRGELVVAYQPKVAMTTGDVCGVEALVRWQHPQHGLLAPGAFIPAAELTSLVRPLTLHVVDAALRAYGEWRARGYELPVAVNLAGPCVMDVDLPSAIAALLIDHGVPADALTLEISEGTVMSDPARAMRVLTALREIGVRLSLDDFGTGQTSLSHLHQLPLNEMKVDRSLVIGDTRLLSSVVEIAHRFGLRAVGEGVETPEIAAALQAAGCDEAQGFLFARPMWADAIPAWVTERRSTQVA